MPLTTAFNAPAVPHTQCRPSTTGWVPVQRQRRDDRPADHVVRLRQVGEHLLRAAGGEGRRGPGGPAWPSSSGCAGAPTSTGSRRRRSKAKKWGAFTLGRLRRHPAGDGERVRRRRRRRPLLRGDAGAVDHEPGRHPGHLRHTRRHQARGGQAALPAGGQRGRGPGGHRRGPLPDRGQPGRAAAAAAGPPPTASAARWAARSPARPAPPTAPGRPGSSASPRNWRRRASSPTRTTRSTRSVTGSPRSRSTRSPQTLRDGLKGTADAASSPRPSDAIVGSRTGRAGRQRRSAATNDHSSRSTRPPPDETGVAQQPLVAEAGLLGDPAGRQCCRARPAARPAGSRAPGSARWPPRPPPRPPARSPGRAAPSRRRPR